MGDININLLDCNNTTQTYENKMAKHGLSKVISCPTREEFSRDRFSSSCIDHVFIRCTEDNIVGGVIKSKITDHYIITISVPNVSSKQHIIKNHLDTMSYQRELNLVRWYKLKNNNDPNEICSSIINIFAHLKKTCTKEKESSVHSHKIDKPWITNKIKHCMSIRDKYFRMHKNNKSNKNYEELYKKHRNTVVNLIKNEKLNYEKKIFEQCKGDSKKIWMFINNILGKNKLSADDVIKNILVILNLKIFRTCLMKILFME
jgi:hypothetical protein